MTLTKWAIIAVRNGYTQISNAERAKALSDFFDNITGVTDSKGMNDLYRTILESIIWYKDGDTIRVEINFK